MVTRIHRCRRQGLATLALILVITALITTMSAVAVHRSSVQRRAEIERRRHQALSGAIDAVSLTVSKRDLAAGDASLSFRLPIRSERSERVAAVTGIGERNAAGMSRSTDSIGSNDDLVGESSTQWLEVKLVGKDRSQVAWIATWFRNDRPLAMLCRPANASIVLPSSRKGLNGIPRTFPEIEEVF